MKKRFLTRLAYDWIIYLLVAILSVFAWSFAFRVYHSPKPYESLYIFVGADVKDRSFESLAKSVLSSDGVELVEVRSAQPNDVVFSQKYGVVGLNNCDVVIVPQSVASSTHCEAYFVEWHISCGLSEFSQQSKPYGVVLENEQKAKLSKYFEFTEENYVVAIPSSSVNSGEDALTDNSVKFVQWLVGYVSL